MAGSEVRYSAFVEGGGPEGEVFSKYMELADKFSWSGNQLYIGVRVLYLFSVSGETFDKIHI
jgi:hypothetical protein